LHTHCSFYFRKHLKSHNYQFECRHGCVDKFAVRRDRDRHESDHHSDINKWVCPFKDCPQKRNENPFKRKDNLLRHLKAIHHLEGQARKDLLMSPQSSWKTTKESFNSRDTVLLGTQTLSSMDSLEMSATTLRKGKASRFSSLGLDFDDRIDKTIPQQPSISPVASSIMLQSSTTNTNQLEESPVKVSPPRLSRNDTPDLNITQTSPIIYSNRKSLSPHYQN
jgi:hypothetical protein